MKVIWEEKDIFVGRKFINPGTEEVWMIGYTVDIDAPRGAPKKYRMISLSDGMCCDECTREQMAIDLTTQGYVPVEIN